MKKYLFTMLLSLATILGCSGGSGSGISVGNLTSVKVMGDSLSDSGAFQGIPSAQDGLGTGRIFSVQSSPSMTTQIWTERIASILGDTQLCNYFKLAGTAAPQTGCASFAVGGSRINNRYASGLEATDPFSVVKQIQTASSLGNFKSTDLLLIEGGGNDAADLFSAYLNAATDGGASFSGIVTTTLNVPVASINNALASSDLDTAGTLYMQILADELYDGLKTNALSKGATHIAVLNIPAITKTPRFQEALDQVGASSGAAARTSAELQANTWIKAY